MHSNQHDQDSGIICVTGRQVILAGNHNKRYYIIFLFFIFFPTFQLSTQHHSLWHMVWLLTSLWENEFSPFFFFIFFFFFFFSYVFFSISLLRSLASMSMGKISDTSDKAIVTKTNVGRKGRNTDVNNLIAATVRDFIKCIISFFSINFYSLILFYDILTFCWELYDIFTNYV